MIIPYPQDNKVKDMEKMDGFYFVSTLERMQAVLLTTEMETIE